MYIHDSVIYDSVACPLKNVIVFRLSLINVYVIVVYRPPSYTDVENDMFLTVLEELVQEKECILLGDFNFPGLVWLSRSVIPDTNRTTLCERNFLDLVNCLGLTQWITEPTYPSSGNYLDLVLTTEPDCVGAVHVCAPLPKCDHCVILFDYVYENQEPNQASVVSAERFLWHKTNFDRLNRALADIDWELELLYLNPSESFDMFASLVSDVCKEIVPRSTRDRKKWPPWRVNPPGDLIRERREAWIAYKAARRRLGRRSQTAHDAFAHFASINRQVYNYASVSQSNYELGLIEDWKEQPKLLHAYIRSKKSTAVTVGPLRQSNGDLCSDPQEMSELFAEAFCSVYSRDVPDAQEPHQMYGGHIPQLQFSRTDVQNLLEAMDGDSAMGPDGMHPLVLKRCAFVLSYPLYSIFCRSIEHGELPRAWKQSCVIPIFKKGSRYDPLNYRPISLTSVCCKTLERIISNHIREYLDTNSLLSEHQFGFRTGYSTSDQLLLVYEEVSACVDDGEVVDIVLCDYSKAFDVVCHSILLAKLSSIGIDGQILAWITSFLSDRSMEVLVKEQPSRPRRVESGVPQGSVLGPLLFLVYINHIAAGLSCKYKIFADDLKIYARTRSKTGLAALETEMQADIDTLARTSSSWGLNMNASKCAVLRFSRRIGGDPDPPTYTLNDNPLPSVQSHRDLGVIIDTSLKFHEHISTVTHKVAGLAQSFLKTTVCRSPEFMLFLLTTHIRPVLEYASCLWNTGYISDLRKLERTQRRWTKRVASLHSLSYGERLRELKLFSVQGRLLRADLIQYWKIFHGKGCIKPDDFFSRPLTGNMRGHCFKVRVTHANTELRQRAFSKRCVNIWNNLPERVVTMTDLKAFKKGLEEAIPDKLYDYV